jgi:hypothetical protein
MIILEKLRGTSAIVSEDKRPFFQKLLEQCLIIFGVRIFGLDMT